MKENLCEIRSSTANLDLDHFFPMSPHEISYKRKNEDIKFAGTYSLPLGSKMALKKWWIGLIEEISDGNHDVGINFLHSPEPA